MIERPYYEYGSATFIKSGVAIDKSSVSELDNTKILNIHDTLEAGERLVDVISFE